MSTLDVHPPVGMVATHMTARACPPEAEIVDHFAAVGGRGFLLPTKDLLYGGTETAMAFDGVLLPESLGLAGQAAISRPLTCRRTPEPVPAPISLSGTAGPAVCGEPGMAGLLGGTLLREKEGAACGVGGDLVRSPLGRSSSNGR